jgi:hypothetical protein
LKVQELHLRSLQAGQTDSELMKNGKSLIIKSMTCGMVFLSDHERRLTETLDISENRGE